MIEIIKFEMVNKGALIAKFTCKMMKWGGLQIRDCTLFESGDKRWVTLPSRQYEVEGKKKYFPYIAYEERNLDDKFKDMIMKAVEEYMSKNLVAQQSPPAQKDSFEDMPF